MANVKVPSSSGSSPKRRRPALTPEARENQLISYAIDLVEQRLLNGTASSQETTHFLKLATTKARLEKEILEEQKKLIVAKTDMIESQKKDSVKFEEAIAAMKKYSGNGDSND